MKKQNGITLIALIITIIVMLILVGVTVTVALNGGLFDKAKEAGNKAEMEIEREQLLSSALTAMGTNGEVDYTLLNTILPDGFTENNGIYTDKYGNKFVVSKNGTVSLYKTIEEVIAEINEDIKNNPTEWQGLDDSIGETGKKITKALNDNNIILSETLDEDNITSSEGNTFTATTTGTYYEEKVEIKIILEGDTTTQLFDIKSFEATKIETLDQVIALMNRTVSSNPNDWYGTETELSEKLIKLLEENNIALEQGYDGDYFFYGEGYIIIPADISYYGEKAKISIKWEEDSNDNTKFYATEFGIIPTIEEVIAEINADITNNPTEWQGLNHSTGETAEKLTSVFNEKYIKATETLDDAVITTEGDITTIEIEVKYFGEQTTIFIETKQDSTTKLYDVLSFRLPVSIEEVIAEINADIAANPTEYQGFDDTKGETNDKLQSIFDEKNIVKLEDFEDGDYTQEGNVITVIVDATYYETPVKISIVLEQNEDIIDILSFGVVE